VTTPAAAWDLTSRHYMVTGAASGIGAAVALQFASMGARLALVDLDPGGLERTLAACAGSGHTTFTFDLRDVEAVPGLVQEAVDRGGPLHGLVHAAGIQAVMPARTLTRAAWQDIFAVNTESGLALAKALQNRRAYAGECGSIVFISSVMGMVGSPGAVAYAMSKAALHGMARSLALELAPKRIRVNCIAPGFVKTPMLERMEKMWSEAQRQAVAAHHPLGFGEPGDIAQAAAFLCSQTGRWITGTVLVVDGGYLAQ